MKSSFFREGQHYSFSNLKESFSLDAEKTKVRINTLKRYNVLKAVRKEKPEYSELSDQDIVVDEIPETSSDFVYQFTFVGVILLDDVILMCYPKYIDTEKIDAEEQFFAKFKIIIKVIEKYNQKNQLVHLYNGDAESKQFNRLAISLHILRDYFENGLYSNQEEIVEQNGDGEILWDKTISETFAFIKNNTPYYLDFYTHDNTENDFDFIRRLHAAVVTKCTCDLNHENLLELFDLEGAELTNQTLDDFGDAGYIKYRLEREIKNQFVTRKQNLLKTLYTYVSEQLSNQSDVSFSLYGTNAFNLVWEKACGQVLGNQMNASWTISKLADENLLNHEDVNAENKAKSISDYIERPEWIIDGDSAEYEGDLIPDILTLRKIDSHNTGLFILDGKYYLVKTEKKDDKTVLRGNPGIQDVVKQYVYNAAVQSFINQFHIAGVANASLIPALESESANLANVKKIGSVPYWSVQRSGFKELPSVQVIKLNAEDVWHAYLSNSALSDDVWNQIEVSPTKNYLYHNEDDKEIEYFNDGKVHALVGFFVKDRFKEVENKDEFIFYFYATNDEKRFPLHPYIDSCTKFIGYNNEKNAFIQGDLKLLPCGRCKIDEVTAEQLTKLTGKKHRNAKTYYAVSVTNAKQEVNLISGKDDLNELIKMNGLNSVLSRYSPKVIDV